MPRENTTDFEDEILEQMVSEDRIEGADDLDPEDVEEKEEE